MYITKYNWNDQVRDDDIGRVCSTHAGEEECMKCFIGKSGRKKTTRNI
jgi:hypothetical protein